MPVSTASHLNPNGDFEPGEVFGEARESNIPSVEWKVDWWNGRLTDGKGG